MSKTELATTVIMPNMYCYECESIWRGGHRCPKKCTDNKTGEIEKLHWFGDARILLREAQRNYHKIICKNINSCGLERAREIFYGTLVWNQDIWPDAADAYVSLFLNALDAQFLMTLKVFLTTVAFRDTDKERAVTIDGIDTGGTCLTMCPEKCIIEPDSWCPHGYDSLGILLELV